MDFLALDSVARYTVNLVVFFLDKKLPGWPFSISSRIICFDLIFAYYRKISSLTSILSSKNYPIARVVLHRSCFRWPKTRGWKTRIINSWTEAPRILLIGYTITCLWPSFTSISTILRSWPIRQSHMIPLSIVSSLNTRFRLCSETADTSQWKDHGRRECWSGYQQRMIDERGIGRGRKSRPHRSSEARWASLVTLGHVYLVRFTKFTVSKRAINVTSSNPNPSRKFQSSNFGSLIFIFLLLFLFCIFILQ